MMAQRVANQGRLMSAMRAVAFAAKRLRPVKSRLTTPVMKSSLSAVSVRYDQLGSRLGRPRVQKMDCDPVPFRRVHFM
jgi:hypothetical protein